MIDLFSLLFLMAVIIFVGVFGELIFVKTRIPDVLWLVLLGIIIGPVLGIVPSTMLWDIAPVFSALALITILFEGGLNLNIYEVFKESSSAFVLASVSFFLTVFVVTFFYYLFSLLGIVSGFTLINGLLLGTIISGSSSLIIMPLVLHSNLRKRLVTLLSIESALTDIFAIVLVIALIGFAVESAANGKALDSIIILRDIAAKFAIGLVAGALLGMIWLHVMKIFKAIRHQLIHHYMLTFAVMLIIYVGIDMIGGSSALAILMFGLVLGNAPQISTMFKLKDKFTVDKDVREFNSQVSFFVKTFFFALIGMMFVLETTSIVIGLSIAILAMGVRFISVRIFCFKEKLSFEERKLISTVVPRGLAAAVLAIMPIQKGIAGTENFTGYVFTVIVSTILIATLGFYLFSRKIPSTEKEAEIEIQKEEEQIREKKEFNKKKKEIERLEKELQKDAKKIAKEKEEKNNLEKELKELIIKSTKEEEF